MDHQDKSPKRFWLEQRSKVRPNFLKIFSALFPGKGRPLKFSKNPQKSEENPRQKTAKEIFLESANQVTLTVVFCSSLEVMEKEEESYEDGGGEGSIESRKGERWSLFDEVRRTAARKVRGGAGSGP